jgi:hypothetical protein
VSELVGRILRHDRILRHVGAGGMGEAYEAEDLKLGRRVALRFSAWIPCSRRCAHTRRSAR